jgi:acetyl-CoA carboxylase carboxyl transferase subunit beta
VSDWRDAVLAGIEPLPRPDGDGGGDGPHREDAVWVGHGRLGRADVVVAVWDFGVHGGSFGERDATAFQAACSEAAATRRPLVTLSRSGGTRLQEGMRALVGIPRAAFGLEQVAAAGVPHIAVADHPTTGGVWVGIVSTADLRVGVAGATVGFSGPRVIEAMTGVAVPRGHNTAESAADAGLLDAVVPPEGLATWLEHALVTLRPDDPQPTQPPVPVAVPERSGWEQVAHSREVDRPAGADLLTALLDEPVSLCGADDTVAAAVGRVAGHRVVVVALGARRAGRVSPAGFGLLTRAAAFASRLDVALVVCIDTAGADPLPLSEQAGVAPAIAAAMQAVLHCAAPTVAVVHGEGGSGGALAGAVTDVVGVTENGWFAALGPEGAGAALRVSAQAAADRMGVAPKDLLASGYADALAPVDVHALRDWLGDRLDALRVTPADERLARRRTRWSSPLPGSPPSVPGPAPDIA